jgi:integrase
MADRLGHANTTVTQNIYQHVRPAQDAAAAINRRIREAGS